MALIIVRREEIYPGKYILSYEWEGGLREPVSISLDVDISKFPFPLIAIPEQGFTFSRTYIRTDVSFWQFPYMRVKILNFLRDINARLIMTAHIWGLVRVYEAEIPTWKHAFKNRRKK